MLKDDIFYLIEENAKKTQTISAEKDDKIKAEDDK